MGGEQEGLGQIVATQYDQSEGLLGKPDHTLFDLSDVQQEDAA